MSGVAQRVVEPVVAPARLHEPDGGSEAERRLAYYRRQLDAVAGENLRKDYEISGLRKELRHHVRAFALLSELHRAIGSKHDLGDIMQTVITSITASLGMDRTVVFQPTDTPGEYAPWLWTGFTEEGRAEEFEERLRGFRAQTNRFAERSSSLLVNRATESSEKVDALRTALELPYLVCVPVFVDEHPIALLLSGRLKETGRVFAPISESDVETFQAIAGLISAVVQSMRFARLEETNRLRTDFFANLSHEFRTPITLSLGPIASMLRGRYGKLPLPAREQLRVVESSQQRLLRLVNQLLELAKAEAGKMDLRLAQVPSFNAFVESRARQFQGLADRRGLSLGVELASEVEQAEVFIDPERFDRILLNLLSNAHKFTAGGGSIVVRTAVRGDSCVLEVEDTGCGIPHEHLPHVFDRFRRVDGSRSREVLGTGIGLALVKDLIELHGGSVSVSSVVGQGTKFTLVVPVGSEHLEDDVIVAWSDEDADTLALRELTGDAAREEKAAPIDEVEQTNERASRGHDHGSPTVLYVDDNRDLRTYVRDLLVGDYNVYLAADGEQGLEIARRVQPDVIVSDLTMPKLDGAGLCGAVREDPALAGVPFVLLTARAGLDARVEGLEVGADEYLTKPFSERELQVRLRNLVRLRANEVRLSREIGAAREIQRMLLPPLPAEHGGYRFDAVHEARNELSGDFFDIARAHDGTVWAYLADVTSHGAAAAQVTLLLKQSFADVLANDSPADVPTLLERLQDRYARFGLDLDVGIQVVRASPSGKVEYSAGNAPDAFVLEPPGVARPLVTPKGPGLSARGANRHRPHASTHVELSPGQALVVYTDGCLEFRSRGRRFGVRRLANTFAQVPADVGWSDAVADRLHRDADGGRFDDDLTIIRIERRR